MPKDAQGFNTVRTGPIIKGAKVPIRQSIRTRFDRSNGLTTTVEWAGAGAHALEGYSDELRRLSKQYEFNQTGVISTLTEVSDGETLGFEETTTDRWEVLANENMFDIKEHPTYGALPIGLKTGILRNLKAHESGKVAAGDVVISDATAALKLTTAEDSGATELQESSAFAFYKLMIRGTTHYPAYNWVLRHTTNAPADWTRNISDSGVGTVYTPENLNTEISNESLWAYPCPPRLRTKISNITLPAESGYITGWLKKPSSEASAANNRIDISTEYVFGNYASIIYG
jgi:hypothetical protein